MVSINALQLLETVVTLRAPLTRDVLAVAKFLVDRGSGST